MHAAAGRAENCSCCCNHSNSLNSCSSTLVARIMAAEYPPTFCTSGARIEVILTEEGLYGSRYAARVVEVVKGKAQVEFEAFTEEEDPDAHVREWHTFDRFQPVPPPTPEGFHQRLTAGDEVEALHDDGWWIMTFRGTQNNGNEFIVTSDMYQVERCVAADQLRPRWKRWGTKWRQLEQMRKPAKAASSKPTTPPKASAARPPRALAPVPAPLPWKAAAAAASTLNKPTATPSHVVPAPMSATPYQKAPAPEAHTGEASPPVSLPPPPVDPLPMSGPTLRHCTALLREMDAREDAVWFAHPVRAAPQRAPRACIMLARACMHAHTRTPTLLALSRASTARDD